MTKLQKAKLISFILAIAMLVIAIANMVCFFVIPEPMTKFEPDEDTDNDQQAGNALGYAVVLIFGVLYFIVIFSVHILYSIAPVIISGIQYFKNNNLSVAMLVLNSVSTLLMIFTLVIFISSSLLKPFFTVLLAISLAISVATVITDIMILAQGKTASSAVQE